MGADTGVQAHTVNDGLGVQAFCFCIGVQFVKVAHPQGKIGVCKELHSLRLGKAHKQGVDVLLDGPLL